MFSCYWFFGFTCVLSCVAACLLSTHADRQGVEISVSSVETTTWENRLLLVESIHVTTPTEQ